ncbi:MAG: DUF3052 family protein [Actinomycetales bacterium]|nr:DUF3052 family protein [Actinomycetales bacterium]
MSATAAADYAGVITRLGVEKDMLVQQVGFDLDCDAGLTAAISLVTGTSVLDEDTDEVVDIVLLWWRDDDGDLTDGLVDSLHPLADNGVIVLLTPKPGRPGHIGPSDIAEASKTAGLQQTSAFNATSDWQGTRLVAPKSARR